MITLQQATEWLQDGDIIEFDGSTGIIKKVGESENE